MVIAGYPGVIKLRTSSISQEGKMYLYYFERWGSSLMWTSKGMGKSQWAGMGRVKHGTSVNIGFRKDKCMSYCAAATFDV